MPNHGYCKNCWWWKEIPTIALIGVNVERKGQCWMHCGDDTPYSIKGENCYCPDYYNRKKGNKEDGTLYEWIKKRK